jgi:hypothetical protein
LNAEVSERNGRREKEAEAEEGRGKRKEGRGRSRWWRMLERSE